MTERERHVMRVELDAKYMRSRRSLLAVLIERRGLVMVR